MFTSTRYGRATDAYDCQPDSQNVFREGFGFGAWPADFVFRHLDLELQVVDPYLELALYSGRHHPCLVKDVLRALVAMLFRLYFSRHIR